MRGGRVALKKGMARVCAQMGDTVKLITKRVRNRASLRMTTSGGIVLKIDFGEGEKIKLWIFLSRAKRV